jgi:hypothetical protein
MIRSASPRLLLGWWLSQDGFRLMAGVVPAAAGDNGIGQSHVRRDSGG